MLISSGDLEARARRPARSPDENVEPLLERDDSAGVAIGVVGVAGDETTGELIEAV